MQIGGQADGCVPAVRDKQDVMLISHPANSPSLSEPAAFGAIGLNDVDRLPFQVRSKALSPRQHFAGGDGQRSVPPQLDESFNIIRRQSFLEPNHIVIGQHLGRLERPLVTVRPILFTAAGIHHQLDVGAHGFARDLD